MIKQIVAGALAGVALVAITGTAGATIVTDQSTMTPVSQTSAYVGQDGISYKWTKQSAMQTFTVGVGGTLVQLGLKMFGDSNSIGGFTVSLFDHGEIPGAAPTGYTNPLFTKTLLFSDLGYSNQEKISWIDLSAAGITVTPGEVMSFTVTGDQPYNSNGVFNDGLVSATYATHAGAQAYLSGNWGLPFQSMAGSSSNFFTNLQFETRVDNLVSDVPEASTWMAMTVGFGVLGTAMRRRRHDFVRA